MLVWFHAVALAHVQKRTLLAPPWYNIPANETWDLNRLSAGECSQSSKPELTAVRLIDDIVFLSVLIVFSFLF